MDFNWIMPILKIPALIVFIFFIAGLILFKFRPKKINMLYGYRTAKSMKSQENWDFSQKYAAIKMAQVGGWLLLLSLTGFIIQFNVKYELIIGLGSVLLFTAYLIIDTERALKSKFPEK